MKNETTLYMDYYADSLNIVFIPSFINSILKQKKAKFRPHYYFFFALSDFLSHCSKNKVKSSRKNCIVKLIVYNILQSLIDGIWIS